MESLISLTKMENGKWKIKIQTCANGSTQQEHTSFNKAASLLAMTELHLITAVIIAKQKRNAITPNIPNTFIQINIEQKPQGK